jgi:hypothetical protein
MMTPGSGTVGSSVVSFEYDFTIVEFTYQYGITDKLSFGVMIPYWDVKNNVTAELDASNATIGTNPLFAMGLLPSPLNEAPFIPIDPALLPPGVPPGVPLTTDQVRDLIGEGLDVDGDGTIDIEGYGYKEFGSWSGSGLSDMEVGVRYQYYQSEKWRLAFTGGVRIPTGDINDPDNLTAYSLGSGAWALLFNFNHDFMPTEKLVINGTFRYELYLPDEELRRVPEAVDRPITANKEEVERDLGDIFEFEVSGTYEFFEGLSLFLLYQYGFKLKDEVEGEMGFNYQALEDETDGTEHVAKVGLTYSTISRYLKKEFPVPLEAYVGYRNRFAGSNNNFKSEYIDFALRFYF